MVTRPRGEGLTTSISTKASGALPASAKLVLGVDTADGVYFLRLDAEVATKTVISVNGGGVSDVQHDTGTPSIHFEIKSELPETGLVLEGKTELPRHCVAPSGLVYAPLKVTWKATPRDEPLNAIVNAPSVPRGARATLDGGASTGDPARWSWEITPKPCPSVALPGENQWTGPTVPAMKMEGRSVSFPLLCDVEVVLEVAKDGETDRSDPVVVKAMPRPWKTKTPHAVQSTFGDRLLATSDSEGGRCYQYDGELGRNVCAIDEAHLPQNSRGRHWIHRDPQAQRFASHPEGVVIAAITEGPFKGLFFASVCNLRIARAEQVHNDLVKTGAVRSTNQKKVVDDFVAHTREHEALHTTLAMTAFRAMIDPAELVEQLVGDDEASLTGNVNAAIYASETLMTEESNESAVKKKLGSRPSTGEIMFPRASGTTCRLGYSDWSDVGH